ncbi:hypothetical protein [Spirillospora sp. NPDC047279]
MSWTASSPRCAICPVSGCREQPPGSPYGLTSWSNTTR